MRRISLGLFVSTLLALSGRSDAVVGPTPKNDKFSAATVLSGLSGEVSDATLDGATAERGEYGDQSVWYRYTPAIEGYLEVEFDEFLSSGGYYNLNSFTGKSLAKLNPIYEAHSDWRFASGSLDPQQVLTIPARKGVPIQLQFESSDLPGAFGFKYRFVSGGGFKVVNAPYVDGWDEHWLFNESAGTVNVTVARVGGTVGTATVSYEISHNTTSNGDINTPLTGTLTFGPGETFKTVQVGLVDDADVEGQESFFFQLVDPSANSVVLSSSIEMLIDSNDSVPANDQFASAITLPGDSGSVTTPSGTATVEASEPSFLVRSGWDGVGQTVWYQWTAAADGILTLNAQRDDLDLGLIDLDIAVLTGPSLGQLRLQPLLGSLDGGATSVHPSLVVNAGTTYRIALIGHGSGGGYTLDYGFEAKSVLRFKKRYMDAYENAPSNSVIVERLGSKVGPVSVNFSAREISLPDDSDLTGVSDDSDSSGVNLAKAGTDFLSAVSALSFANGEAEKPLAVSIVRDTKKEKEELFCVELTGIESGDAILETGNTKQTWYVYDGNPISYPLNNFYNANWFGVLVRESGNGGLGAVSLTTTHKGNFTGTVQWEGKKYRFKGLLPPGTEYQDGVLKSDVTVTVPRGKLAPLTVKLHHETYEQGKALLNGSVTDGVSKSNFTPDEALNLKAGDYEYPEPTTGVYTMALEPDANIPAGIRAKGVASINVKPSGKFTLTGTLTDGTKLSAGGQIGIQDLDPNSYYYFSYYRRASFYVPLYRGAGQLAGSVRLSYLSDPMPPAAFGDGEGSFSWIRPQLLDKKGNEIGVAFAGTLSPFVSRFQVLPGGLIFDGAQPVSLKLSLEDGGLPPGGLLVDVSLKKAVATLTAAFKANLTVQPPTGLLQGSFTPTGGKATPYKGVILQNLQKAVGFFQNGSAAGKVELAAP